LEEIKMEFEINKRGNFVQATNGAGIIFNFNEIKDDGTSYIFYYHTYYIGFIDKKYIIKIIE